MRGPSHPQRGARPTRVAAQLSSPSLLLGLRQKHYTDAPWSRQNCLFFSERSNCDFSPSFSKYTLKFQESFRFTERLQREHGGSPHAPRLPSHTVVVHLSQRRSVGWELGFTTVLVSSFRPRTHMTLGQHVSLGSAQLRRSLWDFPCLGDPAVVRTTGPLFCRMPLNLDLSEAFLMMGSSWLLCCPLPLASSETSATPPQHAPSA